MLQYSHIINPAILSPNNQIPNLTQSICHISIQSQPCFLYITQFLHKILQVGFLFWK